MCTCRNFSSLTMFRRGDKPLVICSGWSEKAFTNPAVFFSRNSRTMKASGDNAVTLRWIRRIVKEHEVNYFSACKTRIPVMSSVGMSLWSISTMRILDVTEKSPPFLYMSCLQNVLEYWRRQPGFPRSPVAFSHLVPNNSKAWSAATQDTQLFTDPVFLARGCID